MDDTVKKDFVNKKKVDGEKNYTPKEIVKELDRYIIGQNEAKKAVAIALRNRWRRQRVPEDLREEILPKNILMIGPTGVGKTEISRRLAKLAEAPFLKVEATKFTEVGYVGRDVEQIVRDLIQISITMTQEKLRNKVKSQAQHNAEERVLNALVGKNASLETRSQFRAQLRSGKLNKKIIEIDLIDNPSGAGFPTLDIPGMPGSQVGMINLNEIFGKGVGQKRKKKKMLIEKIYKPLMEEESDKLIDQEKIISIAKKDVEENGIVFLDEMDKICARSERTGGDVSREGVQRDLLPIIEGTTVSTKYGSIKTDHILFIASGAFHLSKPSDLLPELQGRLPIRVELNALTKDDFVKILNEPENSLIKQYKALLKTEQVDLDFRKDSIDEIAKLSTEINSNVENIGARRLHTVLEKLVENISFNATEYKGKKIKITAKQVKEEVGKLAKDIDLSKFIL
jgi:ATP-dependent HslUV protease ATP-binding subunit HslU